MTRIKSYDDLLLEKIKLQSRLAEEKAILRQEVQKVKQSLSPLFKVLSFFGADGGNGSLLRTGAQAGVGLLASSTVAKAGWVARLLVPALLGGVTGKLIDKFKTRHTRENGRE